MARDPWRVVNKKVLPDSNFHKVEATRRQEAEQYIYSPLLRSNPDYGAGDIEWQKDSILLQSSVITAKNIAGTTDTIEREP